MSVEVSTSLLFRVAQALLSASLAEAPLEALALVGPIFDADRAWLIRLDAELQVFWVAYEWCAKGVEPFLPDLPGVPVALIAHPLKDFLRNRSVVFPDIEKLPPDAQALKEEMRREGNLATAGVPLFRHGRLVALVGLDDTRKVHAWTDKEMRALREVAELILTAADRALVEERTVSQSGVSIANAQPVAAAGPGGCYLRAGNCHVQVRWDDIVTISAEGDHTRVRLVDGREFLELKALAVWAAMLPGDLFGRVHRSHIVAWRRVKRLRRGSGGRWSLELDRAADALPVGRNYQSVVRERINLRAV